MDCVSVRYWTVPVVSVLTCILQCTIVNCLKLRQLKENKVFYPQGGCGRPKNLSFRHWCHLGNSPSPAKGQGGGGRETFEISPGGFVVLFLFLLASEEQVPKQSKQVSIVDRIPMLVKLSYNFVLTHAWKNVVTAKYSVYCILTKTNTIPYCILYSTAYVQYLLQVLYIGKMT